MSKPAYSQYADEQRVYTFDFSDEPEVMNGATVASAVAAANDVALTLGMPSVSSPHVTVRISAGADGHTYQIAVTATLSTGSVVDRLAQLTVQDPLK